MSRTHELQWGMLKNAWRADRLSHAYVFSGNDDVLQETYAMRLACLVVCLSPDDGKPCERCLACKNVLSNAHPDVHVIDTTSASASVDLTISLVRGLKDVMNKKPWTSPVHVAIIKRAHAMNATAQSALLKLLEEPPGRSLFLLCASNPGALLDTIRSRAQEARWYSFLPAAPSKESLSMLDTMLLAPAHEKLRLAKTISEDQDMARQTAQNLLAAGRERMLRAAAAGDRETLSRLKIFVERLQEGTRTLEATNASPLLVLERIALSVS